MATASAQDEDVLRPHGTTGDDRSKGDGSARASTSFIIGPELGRNLSFFSSKVTGAPDKSYLYNFESGLGVSWFAGIYLELGLNRQFGIGARVFYDMKSFGGTQDGTLIDCPDTTSGLVEIIPIQTEYSVSTSYLTINPLLRWSPIEELIVQIGPVIQLSTADFSTTLTFTIPESETCRYNLGKPNESRTSSATVDAAPAIKTRFGIDLGVGYRLALAPSIAVVPRIGYQYMFTNFDEDDLDGIDASRSESIGQVPYTHTDFKLTSLQASVALWFTL